MNFKTPYTGVCLCGEDYTRVKSITQPEQVLPLNRIIQGLKNGSILLDSRPQQFDIAEHDIDVAAGLTPEQTNANIAAATLRDNVATADAAGFDDITAHPGFQVEDAHSLIDRVDAAVEQAAIKKASSSRSSEQGSEDSSKATDAKHIPDDEKLSSSGGSTAA